MEKLDHFVQVFGREASGEEGVEGEDGARAVYVGHFIEQLEGVIEHLGLAVEDDEAGGEVFVFYIWILLLMLEDVVNVRELAGSH